MANKTLKWAGIELRRLPKQENICLSAGDENGHIIEFVGLPGVGKTYLMNHCLKVIGQDYVTQRALTASSISHQFKDLEDPDLKDLYKRLIDVRIRDILNGIEKADNVRYECLRIQALANLLVNNIPVEQAYPARILTDEGISKNFTAALLQIVRGGHPGAIKALSRRSLVFLSAAPEVSAAQLTGRQDRRKAGWNKLDLLETMTLEERIEHYADMQSHYQSWIEELAPYTKKTVGLSRQDALEENVEAVVEAIRSVS